MGHVDGAGYFSSPAAVAASAWGKLLIRLALLKTGDCGEWTVMCMKTKSGSKALWEKYYRSDLSGRLYQNIRLEDIKIRCVRRADESFVKTSIREISFVARN